MEKVFTHIESEAEENGSERGTDTVRIMRLSEQMKDMASQCIDVTRRLEAISSSDERARLMAELRFLIGQSSALIEEQAKLIQEKE